MVTPQDKANELYGRYLSAYMKVTDITTARINARDCVHAVCDSMIHEVIEFGNPETDNIYYTTWFWIDVKKESDKFII